MLAEDLREWPGMIALIRRYEVNIGSCSYLSEEEYISD